MSILSFSFILALPIAAALYYLMPKRFQWVWLLLCSLGFFIGSSGIKRLPFLLMIIAASYIGGLLIPRAAGLKKKRLCLAVSIGFLVLMLLTLKTFDKPVVSACNALFARLNIGFQLVEGESVLAPIGISYFTLSTIGYLLDVYWEKCSPQANIFKHSLYVCYFPALTSGPIVTYERMREQLFSTHSFDYTAVKFGFQRMLWGYFKKLVVANRLALITGTVFADTAAYSGLYIPFAVLCYALQIYTDFSGCMDIILGASEVFGVKLPENFQRPFFSKNLSEFWRRWHMSLGVWSKEYIMYPLLKTELFQKIGKSGKKTFGKRVGKSIPTYIGLGIVWLIIGLWHGGSVVYVFAAGFLPWLFMVGGQLLQPLFDGLTRLLRVNTHCWSYRLFCRLRTLFLMCVIWLFATAKSISQSFGVIKSMFSQFNPWILTDGSIYKLGMDRTNVYMLLLCFLLILCVGILQEKGYRLRESIARQNTVFRWVLYLGAVFFVILFGIYGPGYNAADFIYAGF